MKKTNKLTNKTALILFVDCLFTDCTARMQASGGQSLCFFCLPFLLSDLEQFLAFIRHQRKNIFVEWAKIEYNSLDLRVLSCIFTLVFPDRLKLHRDKWLNELLFRVDSEAQTDAKLPGCTISSRWFMWWTLASLSSSPSQVYRGYVLP